MKRMKAGLLMVGVLAVGAWQASGAPIINSNVTWDATTEGWVATDDGTQSWSASGGVGNSGYIRVTMPANFLPRQTTLVGDQLASGGLLGDGVFSPLPDPAGYYTATFYLMFEDALPSIGGLAFYFGNGTDTWVYDLPLPSSLNTWTAYTVPFLYSPAWLINYLPGSQAAFDAALASVDWIGIHVIPSGMSQFDWGMDNLELNYVVPEPETVCLLLAVAIGLGLTFRSRLNELLGRMSAICRRLA